MFHDPQYDIKGGWALWTWKRGLTANPTMQGVTIPALWAKTMKWITAPAFNPQPTPAEALTGSQQYLAAVALAQCTENDVLAASLK
jgi:hypothetical protein